MVVKMKQEPPKEKCPKNFKLYTAFVLGITCVVIILVIFDFLQRGRAEHDEQLQYKSQTAAYVSESYENNSAVTPWLGIEILDIDETMAGQLGLGNNDGVLVNKVVQGSPADDGGIERGDVIVRFDHRSVKDASVLQNLVADLSIGQRIQVVVVRNGDIKSLYVKIGVAPSGNTNIALMENLDLSEGGGVLQWGMELSSLTPTLAQSFGISENNEGVVVTQVQPGTRAALAGLQSGDLIMSVNSSPTPDMSTFLSAISSTREAVFDISRGNENLYLMAYK